MSENQNPSTQNGQNVIASIKPAKVTNHETHSFGISAVDSERPSSQTKLTSRKSREKKVKIPEEVPDLVSKMLDKDIKRRGKKGEELEKYL